MKNGLHRKYGIFFKWNWNEKINIPRYIFTLLGTISLWLLKICYSAWFNSDMIVSFYMQTIFHLSIYYLSIYVLNKPLNICFFVIITIDVGIYHFNLYNFIILVFEMSLIFILMCRWYQSVAFFLHFQSTATSSRLI